MMAQEKPEAELSNFKATVSETVKTASRSTGAEPTTSLQQISEDASQNANLRLALESEIQSALSQRIQNDPDFIPEKYPNTEKLFKGDRKK